MISTLTRYFPSSVTVKLDFGELNNAEDNTVLLIILGVFPVIDVI